MHPNAKTTYRRENDEGQIEIRKSFSVERDRIKTWTEEKDGTEITFIEVPVSSTSLDRDGDAFSEEGLSDLKAQLDSGSVGMWLDHGLSPETNFPDYRVLEQIGGWKRGEIEENGGDDLELKGVGALRPSSDDAAELETMLDEGIAPVGFSVGFIIESENEREDIPGKEFEQTDLLEISAVGIPSNPDAMVSDSAMATAKAVAGTDAFDGEPEELARAITREARSLPYVQANNDDQQETKTMTGESSENPVIEALRAFLDADGDGSDPLPAALEWVGGEHGEERSDSIREYASEEFEADDLRNVTVERVLESKQDDDDDDDDEEDDDDDDEEEESTDSGEGKEPELRSVVREALKETLPEALTSEEALRSLISEEVREALSEEEFSVEVTEDFKETLVEELRSELFKDPGEGGSKPSPAGTISTYDPDEEQSSESGDGGESGGEQGGSENASKPSPSV